MLFIFDMLLTGWQWGESRRECTHRCNTTVASVRYTRLY